MLGDAFGKEGSRDCVRLSVSYVSHTFLSQKGRRPYLGVACTGHAKGHKFPSFMQMYGKVIQSYELTCSFHL